MEASIRSDDILKTDFKKVVTVTVTANDDYDDMMLMAVITPRLW